MLFLFWLTLIVHPFSVAVIQSSAGSFKGWELRLSVLPSCRILLQFDIFQAFSFSSTQIFLLGVLFREWPGLFCGLLALVPKPVSIHSFFLMHRCFIVDTSNSGNIGCSFAAFSFCINYCFQFFFLMAHINCFNYIVPEYPSLSFYTFTTN